jgi:hypothetical protein
MKCGKLFYKGNTEAHMHCIRYIGNLGTPFLGWTKDDEKILLPIWFRSQLRMT